MFNIIKKNLESECFKHDTSIYSSMGYYLKILLKTQVTCVWSFYHGGNTVTSIYQG